MKKMTSLIGGRVTPSEFNTLNEKNFKLYSITIKNDTLQVGKTQMFEPPKLLGGQEDFLIAILIDQSPNQIMNDLHSKWDVDAKFTSDIFDTQERNALYEERSRIGADLMCKADDLSMYVDCDGWETTTVAKETEPVRFQRTVYIADNPDDDVATRKVVFVVMFEPNSLGVVDYKVENNE